MPPSERLRTIVITSGLNVRTNVRERTPIATRAGLVAGGVGEIFIFNETYLGLAVIAIGLFADRKTGERNHKKNEMQKGVRNNV